MLGLGLASSHAPSMFRPVESWPTIHRWLIDDVRQPHQLAQETPEVLRSYFSRIEKGFHTLRERLEAYRPDALLVMGDDQGEVFTPSNTPSFCIFACPEVRGTLNVAFIGEPEEENHITIPGHPELANYLLEGLVQKGFDLSFCRELKALGRPKRGIGHAFTRPVFKLTPKLDLPVINFHVNAYFSPLPTASRCYELGQAMAELLESRSERVAIMASGGLSHDPKGPRSGWIDTALDQWVLTRLERGDGEALRRLFRFDSDTLRGGTGEIRAWIVAAGACAGARATIVDYIPAHHAVTGLGFAYWAPEEIRRARKTRNLWKNGREPFKLNRRTRVYP